MKLEQIIKDLSIINNTDYEIFNEIFSSQLLSKISDQYLSVKNYQNDEYIDLPRINNNNIIIKTLVSHKRLNLNYFSYLFNNIKKTILHNYSKVTFENANQLDLNKKVQSLHFSLLLHFLNKNKDSFQFHNSLFLSVKEASYLINHEAKHFNYNSDVPIYPFTYSAIKYISLTPEIKQSFYKNIEYLIELDKDFSLAYLFNINTLYDVGLPLHTDAKNVYEFKQSTFDKIERYNNIVNIDFQNSENVGNKYHNVSLSFFNNSSYTVPSVYFETLSNLALSIPSKTYYHHSKINSEHDLFSDIYTDENYSLENLVIDFLTPNNLSYLEKDFSFFNKKDKKNYFFQSQLINAYYPLCKEVFDKNLYTRIPYLTPVYWDNIIKILFQYKKCFIAEQRFSEKHLKLSITDHPSIIFHLILTKEYHEALLTQTSLSHDLYNIFQKEKPWEKIFALNKLNYNEEQLGQSKKTAIDNFINNTLPLIRSNYLNDIIDVTSSITKNKKKI